MHPPVTRLAALSALVLSLLLASAPMARAGDAEPGFVDTLVVGSLNIPTGADFLPDGRLIVIQKDGAVKLFDGVSTTLLVTIPVCADSEMGLVGIAIDPGFAGNGFIYLYRTHSAGDCTMSSGRSNEVIRVTMGPGDTINIGSLVTLFTGIRTDLGNHDGGGLRIGPDGKLYVAVGDTGLGDNQGGPGSSTNPYSQDLNEIEGKILRLNLDGTIPADNPYFGQAGKRGEIFASGFRNPFRFGFDPVGGGLWLGDVGDLSVEELDVVTAGGNYGWPHCEGTQPSNCENPGDVEPIFDFPHGDLDGAGCVIGGAFAGAAFDTNADAYVFADFNSSRLYLAHPNGTRDGIVGTPTAIVINAESPVDVIRGPDGAIYYTAISGGEIRRVAAGTLGPQLLVGKKIDLHANPNAVKRRASLMLKDSSITLGGLAGNPTLADSTLRLVGATFDVTYDMPKENWRIIGKPTAVKGYKYKDNTLASGPVKTAKIQVGKVINVSAKGAALAPIDLSTDPEPVAVVLSAGGVTGQLYCAEFGGTVTYQPTKQRFRAKDVDAPAACAP